MLLKTSLYIFISTLALTIIWQPSYGQICVDDYFYTDFNTATVQKPVATITTGQNEILMAGNAKRYNSLLEGGWLTKFSAQGTVLWSKQYYTGMFNFTNFTGIVPAGNDSYIISANVGDVDTASNINPLPHLSEYGLVLKVDKYGNVIWSKRLTNLIRPFASSDVTSIESLPGSDFILALTYYTTSSYRAVMRMDVNGNVKWSTLINSNSLKANYGDAKLKFTSKGNVILSMYANVLDNDYSYQRQGYYFASINAATGERMWSRFFL